MELKTEHLERLQLLLFRLIKLQQIKTGLINSDSMLMHNTKHEVQVSIVGSRHDEGPLFSYFKSIITDALDKEISQIHDAIQELLTEKSTDTQSMRSTSSVASTNFREPDREPLTNEVTETVFAEIRHFLVTKDGPLSLHCDGNKAHIFNEGISNHIRKALVEICDIQLKRLAELKVPLKDKWQSIVLNVVAASEKTWPDWEAYTEKVKNNPEYQEWAITFEQLRALANELKK